MQHIPFGGICPHIDSGMKRQVPSVLHCGGLAHCIDGFVNQHEISAPCPIYGRAVGRVDDGYLELAIPNRGPWSANVAYDLVAQHQLRVWHACVPCSADLAMVFGRACLSFSPQHLPLKFPCRLPGSLLACFVGLVFSTPEFPFGLLIVCRLVLFADGGLSSRPGSQVLPAVLIVHSRCVSSTLTDLYAVVRIYAAHACTFPRVGGD